MSIKDMVGNEIAMMAKIAGIHGLLRMRPYGMSVKYRSPLL
jgi:hypothetical protein